MMLLLRHKRYNDVNNIIAICISYGDCEYIRCLEKIYFLVVINRAANICSYNKAQYNYNIIIVNEADKFIATSIQ